MTCSEIEHMLFLGMEKNRKGYWKNGDGARAGYSVAVNPSVFKGSTALPEKWLVIGAAEVVK
jgi:hypothetical protein